MKKWVEDRLERVYVKVKILSELDRGGAILLKCKPSLRLIGHLDLPVEGIGRWSRRRRVTLPPISHSLILSKKNPGKPKECLRVMNKTTVLTVLKFQESN